MSTKMIKVHEDVHELIKTQAERLGMTIMDYVRFLAYTNDKKGKK